MLKYSVKRFLHSKDGPLYISWVQFQRTINPLSPDMKMHILQTVLHTFLRELVRMICLNIKTFSLLVITSFIEQAVIM